MEGLVMESADREIVELLRGLGRRARSIQIAVWVLAVCVAPLAAGMSGAVVGMLLGLWRGAQR